jgi:succinate dehydrogenase / fumarate reductase membrane anchor subunit
MAQEKPAKIAMMQSPLGRVRGHGSARAGSAHWWAERVSAAALMPLTLWFIFLAIRMAGANQDKVAAYFAHPFHAGLMLTLIVLTFYHAALGLQVVIEDYTPAPLKRHIYVLAVQTIATVLALTAAVAVIKLAIH